MPWSDAPADFEADDTPEYFGDPTLVYQRIQMYLGLNPSPGQDTIDDNADRTKQLKPKFNKDRDLVDQELRHEAAKRPTKSSKKPTKPKTDKFTWNPGDVTIERAPAHKKPQLKLVKSALSHPEHESGEHKLDTKHSGYDSVSYVHGKKLKDLTPDHLNSIYNKIHNEIAKTKDDAHHRNHLRSEESAIKRYINHILTHVSSETLPSAKDAIMDSEHNKIDPDKDYYSLIGEHSVEHKDYTPLQTEALKNYAGIEYSSINHALRKDRDSNYIKRLTTRLDSALKHSKVTKPLRVYRGISLHLDVKPGDIIADKGYTSTSLSANKAIGFRKSTFKGYQSHMAPVFEITVPVGSHAVFMNSDRSEMSEEHEILLPRNSKFKITKVEHVDKDFHHTIIHAELLPASARKKSEPLHTKIAANTLSRIQLALFLR